MAKINPDKKQVEYWTGRNERMFLNGEADILDYAKSLKKQYTKASKSIEDEIQKFYGKFAVDNNYTMADLNKLLNRDELKNFRYQVDNMVDYMKNNFDDKDYVKNLKLLRAKSRISRLQELKTKIDFEVEKLYEDVNVSLGDKLQETFEDAYYETIFNSQKFLGFSSDFAMLNKKAIQKAVSTPYMTENYTTALYKNKTNLMNILNQKIPQGIILGYNPNKLAQEVVTKKVDQQYYYSTVRLIRTEYNLILNDATAQGYQEAGIEKYQILATLDNRTSDICREMDGEIFKITEKEVGINYPPFHPNCRTTTIPYFEPDEFDTEIERYIKDEDGIRHKITDDTDYEEWKNALKENKDGIGVYNNNDIADLVNYRSKNYIDFKISKFSDFKDIGKTYFDMPSNESLDKYVKFPHNLEGKIRTDKNLLNELLSVQNDITNLEKESLINFKLYSAKFTEVDYSKHPYLISGTISKDIANNYKNNAKGKDIVTFYIQKGANIVSTYNTSNNQFNTQGEIILPLNSKIKKINKKTYIVYK